MMETMRQTEQALEGLIQATRRSPKMQRMIAKPKCGRPQTIGRYSYCQEKPVLVLHGTAMCYSCARDVLRADD